MTRFRAWGVGGLSFGFFLTVNPLFLVSCGQDDFEYDEADMLAVVDELNQAEVLAFSTASGPSSHQLRFALEQSAAGGETARLAPSSSWISQAHACTHRTFVEEAGACMSVSELMLQGTLFVEQDGSVVRTLEVEGSMLVPSRLLHGALFYFNYDGGTVSLDWDESRAQPFSLESVEGDVLSDAPAPPDGPE